MPFQLQNWIKKTLKYRIVVFVVQCTTNMHILLKRDKTHTHTQSLIVDLTIRMTSLWSKMWARIVPTLNCVLVRVWTTLVTNHDSAMVGIIDLSSLQLIGVHNTLIIFFIKNGIAFTNALVTWVHRSRTNVLDDCSFPTPPPFQLTTPCTLPHPTTT